MNKLILNNIIILRQDYLNQLKKKSDKKFSKDLKIEEKAFWVIFKQACKECIKISKVFKSFLKIFDLIFSLRAQLAPPYPKISLTVMILNIN